MGVVVLNFCHSSGVHTSMARMERELSRAGVAEKTFVMSTTGQWPGSITPRLLSAVLKGASNTDPTQSALVNRITTACEMNYDSYKKAQMLMGRGYSNSSEPPSYLLTLTTITCARRGACSCCSPASLVARVPQDCWLRLPASQPEQATARSAVADYVGGEEAACRGRP